MGRCLGVCLGGKAERLWSCLLGARSLNPKTNTLNSVYPESDLS